MYNLEHDDFERPPRDPFRRTWFVRLFGSIYWLGDALRFWLCRPFVWLGERLAGYLGIAAWRIERLFGGVRRQATGLVDDLVSTVEDRTVRSSWSRSAAAGLRTLRAGCGARWLEFLVWTEESAFRRAMTAPLRAIVWLGQSAGSFLVEWAWTREFRQLLYGLPAMVLLMPLLICAVRLPFYTKTAIANHYRFAADEALAAQDFSTADLYFRKLTLLGAAHERIVWRSALMAQEQGDYASAYEQLRPLAEQGLFEAHVWIAEAIAEGHIEQQNPRALELTASHVQQALQQRPDDATLQLWLAEICLVQGKSDESLALLGGLNVNRLPWPARNQLANAYARLGYTDQAVQTGRSVARHYAQENERRDLDAREFAHWATALELSGNVSDTLRVLFDGLKRYPNDALLATAAVDMGLAAMDQAGAGTDWERQWSTITAVLDVAPDRGPVLTRVAQMLSVPQLAPRALELLDREEESGPLPAPVYRTLADRAVGRNDLATARRLYQRAVDADPQLHPALNNLAYLTATEPPVDLPRALQFVSRALELEPDNPHYLETRGQILIRLEQWTPAVDDLVRALNGMPEKIEIHRSLATAYRQLGQLEQSQRHASQADR